MPESSILIDLSSTSRGDSRSVQHHRELFRDKLQLSFNAHMYSYCAGMETHVFQTFIHENDHTAKTISRKLTIDESY